MLIDIILYVLYVIVFMVAFIYIASLPSIQFCFVQMAEGTAVTIVRNNKDFSHFLIRFRGHHLNDPRLPGYKSGSRKISFPMGTEVEEIEIPYRDWDVLQNDPGVSYHLYRWGMWNPLNWFAAIGIFWFGLSIPPFRYTVEQRSQIWVEAMQKAGENEAGDTQLTPRFRDEQTQIFKLNQVQYWLTFHQLETKDGLGTRLDVLVATTITNLYSARYNGQLNRLHAAQEAAARLAVARREFPQVTQEAVVEGEEFVDPFMATSRDLVLNVGTKIDGIDIVRVEPEGKTPEETQRLRQTIAAQAEAKLTGAGKIETAKADREAKILTAEGEEKAIRLVGDAKAEAARKLLEAETKTPEVFQLSMAKADASRSAGATTLVLGGSSGVLLNVPQNPPTTPQQGGTSS